MADIENAFCPNTKCKDYGLRNHGNIGYRGKYGKDQIIHHAAEGVGVRATSRLLNMNKDTVNRVILRAGEHCEMVLSSLLRSLKLKETQLDELWAFVKKRRILAKKNYKKKSEQSGSGPLLILPQD